MCRKYDAMLREKIAKMGGPQVGSLIGKQALGFLFLRFPMQLIDRKHQFALLPGSPAGALLLQVSANLPPCMQRRVSNRL